MHVPFKGNAEVLNALLGGHVKVHFALSASTLQHVRSGAVRVLAVTTEKRMEALPDVPTIAELGYPEFEISSWQAMFAPAGTPKDVIAKINAETIETAGDAGGARAHPARKAPIRSPARPSNSTSASATRSRSGRRW